MRSKASFRVFVFAPILIVGVLALAWITLGEGSSAAPEKPQGRVCVSAEVWSADDGDRPCARIVRVWEDGSTRIRVTSADGTYQFTANTGARE